MISLTVVVPATDSPPTLRRCLDAIARADGGPDELVVVDGPGSLSASAARNVGARRAEGDLVVFVDADVEVHPDTFERIRASFASTPGLTALFGSYDDTPSHPGLVSRFRNLLHHHVHQCSAGPAETFWTGLGAVRRRAFLAAGGFDEARYPHPSIEDIELGTRLVAAGHDVALDSQIQGTHLKEWTLRSMLWTDLVRRGIPWVALQARAGRPSRALNCGWRHRSSALAVAALVGGAVLGSLVVGLVGLVALVGLNRSFYSLLVRRLGPPRAAAGVVLHGLHHLVAIVAVPLGLAVVAVDMVTSRQQRPEPAVGPAAE